ncbi:MAG: ribosomal protein S18-alanine N-acetyltransferase [Emcibacteraceae bacterium]|nr:ribosomal protein S18-alanine N-acetyltransferase [Emcibacteraceae bacterium]
MIDRENVAIIQMGIEGAELLSEIYAEAFKKTPEQQWGKEAFCDFYSISGTIGYVIKEKEQPIGFLLLRKIIDEAEIITFCILPKWCQNGYGKYLLEWVIDELQQQSIKRFFLEVRENNDAAVRLYNKCSFEIIGRRKGYYKGHQNGNIDALVMQLRLID